MAAWPKISRGAGYFRKIFGQGGYTKNTPLPPLFPLPGYYQTQINWYQILNSVAHGGTKVYKCIIDSIEVINVKLIQTVK